MGMIPDQYADGTDAFFTTERPAWHNRGTVVSSALAADEAITMIKADTPVTLEDCYALVNDQYIRVPDYFVTGRVDPVTGLWKPFRPVGSKYTVIQDPKVFEICNDIVDESGAHFETAGLMKNGAVVFLSMKLPNSLTFGDGTEVIELYLVAVNSHDGSRAFQIMVTPVRPVCDNTVQMAIDEAVSRIAIRHTASSEVRIEEARHALDLSFNYIGTYRDEVENLLSQPFSRSEFHELADALIPPAPVDARDFVQSRQEREVAMLKSMWELPTQDPIRGTKWGAYNSVVEYADFHSPVKAKPEFKAQARAERTLLDGGARIKDKAFALLKA